MATTQFAFGEVGTDLPTFYAATATVEAKTPSGTSAATTASAAECQSVCRVVSDVQVMVSFGAAPNATTDSVKFLLPAGAVEYFRVKSGDKAAVVTA